MLSSASQMMSLPAGLGSASSVLPIPQLELMPVSQGLHGAEEHVDNSYVMLQCNSLVPSYFFELGE